MSKVLEGEHIADGLSVITKTSDGSSYAFSKLILNDKGISDLGDAL